MLTKNLHDAPGSAHRSTASACCCARAMRGSSIWYCCGARTRLPALLGNLRVWKASSYSPLVDRCCRNGAGNSRCAEPIMPEHDAQHRDAARVHRCASTSLTVRTWLRVSFVRNTAIICRRFGSVGRASSAATTRSSIIGTSASMCCGETLQVRTSRCGRTSFAGVQPWRSCLDDKPEGLPGKCPLPISSSCAIRIRLRKETLMLNELYLAVLYRPVAGAATGLLSRLLAKSRPEEMRAELADCARCVREAVADSGGLSRAL